VRKTEDYSYEKFVWEISEKASPKAIELGGKKVEIFQKDEYTVTKKACNKTLLKEIWATGSILDGNSSGRFFRDYLTGRYIEDGLGVLYKVYGIGDDDLPYRYFTGPQREGATKGKYYQGVPSSINSGTSEAIKKKPIITFFDLAGDFGNCRHEGGVDFRSGKKPIILFKKLFEILKWEKSDIVLDFFAGSASTAHAIMQQNLEDEYYRKFIMVQIPELCDEKSEAYKQGFKTIADISKERIRRAGKKIKEEAGLIGEKLDIGFRVLKVDTSNMKDVYYTPDAVSQETLAGLIDNIKDDRTDEDLLFQVLLDWGIDLTLPITTEQIADKPVHFVDENALAACFAPGIDEDFVKELASRKPLRAVFRDGSYGSDATKINVEQIFKLLSPHTEVKSI
jgi:adenine-specific DNA-methyltransferase